MDVAIVPSRLRKSAMLFCLLGISLMAPSRVLAQVNRIDDVLPKMVKVFGAGGLRNLEAYSTGFLISADGHIATIWNHVLDANFVTVVLNDGRRFTGKVVNAEPQLNFAVVKLDTEETDLPFVDLSTGVGVSAGTRIFAFSNMFKVATGDEPVSVMHGVIAARTKLTGRRGAFEVPYDGEVYVIDSVINNAGAGGGLVTDLAGRPVAMIGRELQNEESNTWINYAIPVDALSEVASQIISGDYTAKRRKNDEDLVPRYRPEDFGLVMIPDVVARTPPFVEAVIPGSFADQQSVRPDDLVLFMNDQLVQSCAAFFKLLGRLEQGDDMRLVLRRGNSLMTLETVAPRKDRR